MTLQKKKPLINPAKKQNQPKPSPTVDRFKQIPIPRKNFILKARTFALELGHQTRIMGIVNVTPDSFSQDGQYKSGLNYKKAVAYAINMVKNGADILDIGGESSRPGAKKITIKEELKRIIPIIEALYSKTKIPISVDTYKPIVAKEALKAGASLVNTIKGCDVPTQLIQHVRDYDAAIILMHMKGTPLTMQKKISYSDVMVEIIKSLQKSKEKCLEKGIKSDKIVLDPGIGFGKSIQHNLSIINRLNMLTILNCPLLIGTSRKSFIGNILNKNTNERLIGTLATVSAATMRGAHIIRVHDVAAAKETVKMMDAILNESEI
ncbi:MAG: dihydropteroate synthase [Candidatus Omnitrophica bacterium]|nr:dihydropteroate synthase [Candidatus Omnitrophota bacterium]